MPYIGAVSVAESGILRNGLSLIDETVSVCYHAMEVVLPTAVN